MYKRLGELRDSKGQQGLWVRMVRGQIKYGVRSMKNQYSYYQVGWDTKVGSNWTVGAAYSKTDGTTSFYRGTADNDHDGAAIYGSYLADDGSFIDLIAKYTHIDTDYETFTVPAVPATTTTPSVSVLNMVNGSTEKAASGSNRRPN